MGDLYAARYVWTAELYEETAVQQESGAIKRAWDYNNSVDVIDCLAESVQSTGLRAGGSSERWSREYADVEWVRILCQDRIDKDLRIGKIMSRDGEEMFPDVIFDISGVTPIGGPMGSIEEYEILAQKAELR